MKAYLLLEANWAANVKETLAKLRAMQGVKSAEIVSGEPHFMVVFESKLEITANSISEIKSLPNITKVSTFFVLPEG